MLLSCHTDGAADQTTSAGPRILHAAAPDAAADTERISATTAIPRSRCTARRQRHPRHDPRSSGSLLSLPAAVTSRSRSTSRRRRDPRSSGRLSFPPPAAAATSSSRSHLSTSSKPSLLRAAAESHPDRLLSRTAARFQPEEGTHRERRSHHPPRVRATNATAAAAAAATNTSGTAQADGVLVAAEDHRPRRHPPDESAASVLCTEAASRIRGTAAGAVVCSEPPGGVRVAADRRGGRVDHQRALRSDQPPEAARVQENLPRLNKTKPPRGLLCSVYTETRLVRDTETRLVKSKHTCIGSFGCHLVKSRSVAATVLIQNTGLTAATATLPEHFLFPSILTGRITLLYIVQWKYVHQIHRIQIFSSIHTS